MKLRVTHIDFESSDPEAFSRTVQLLLSQLATANSQATLPDPQPAPSTPALPAPAAAENTPTPIDASAPFAAPTPGQAPLTRRPRRPLAQARAQAGGGMRRSDSRAAGAPRGRFYFEEQDSGSKLTAEQVAKAEGISSVTVYSAAKRAGTGQWAQIGTRHYRRMEKLDASSASEARPRARSGDAMPLNSHVRGRAAAHTPEERVPALTSLDE